MPDRDAKTVRDLIYYQYAKIIAKSSFGYDAKSNNYGFIKQTFRKLQSGQIVWSDIIREDKQFIQSDKKCIYCGSPENLQWEHIVPRSTRINDRCPSCEKIHGIHNQVWACSKCNLEKSNQGLYTYLKKKYPGDKKFYDKIPPLLEKKYLKTIFYCHECAGTIDKEQGDDISVLDIDKVLK